MLPMTAAPMPRPVARMLAFMPLVIPACDSLLRVAASA